MYRSQLFLPVVVLTVFVLSTISQADVSIVDIESDIRFSNERPFNTGVVETGSGSPGDYELIACGVVNPNKSDSFQLPSPGEWTELDTGQCGGSFSCIGGIWGRFTNNPNSENIACNWTEVHFVFAAGSMRFSGVDADPIIAVSCDTGTGDSTATAPSVVTEAGSFVARIYTFTPFTIVNIEPSTFAQLVPFVQYDSLALNTFQFVGSDGSGDFFEEAGPTGTADLTFALAPISWRACTIAHRMGTPPSLPIPTMSEWGFMAVAAFMGVAGIWFLRRRQAQRA